MIQVCKMIDVPRPFRLRLPLGSVIGIAQDIQYRDFNPIGKEERKKLKRHDMPVGRIRIISLPVRTKCSPAMGVKGRPRRDAKVILEDCRKQERRRDRSFPS